MTAVVTSFPFNISQTSAGQTSFLFQDVIIGTKRSMSLANANTWAANQFRSISFSSVKAMNLFVSVNAATTSYEIKDIRGNPITTTRQSPIVSTVAASLVPNAVYIMTIFSSIAVAAANTVLVNLTGFTTPTVFSFFENGFENQVPSSVTNIVPTTDINGQITYNFSNYPCVAGQQLLLCIAKFASQNGTVSVISSNPNMFLSFSDPFNVNSSLYLMVKPLMTSNFTGTLAITISGVGISNQVDIDVSGDLNLHGSSVYSDYRNVKNYKRQRLDEDNDDYINDK